MKKVCYFFALAICFVFAFSGFLSVKSAKVYANENLKVLAFGDSIAAGYAPNVSPYSDLDETDDEVLLQKRQMLDNYVEYYNADYGTFASKSAFSYIFAKNANASATVKSYANSGDTSTDLANLLTQDNYVKTLAETNKEVTILNQKVLNDIKQANVITLCIGANDVLGLAIQTLNQTIQNNQISKLLTGFDDTELSQYSANIQQNVQTFKSNYQNIILPVLCQNSNVYVMTIYNPYRFLGIAENFNGFRQLLQITIDGLNQINKTIRDSANNNVIVIDVATNFSNYSERQYTNYVNVDLSQIDMMSLANMGSGDMPYYFDPHPTPLGQKTIAELYGQSYSQDTTTPISTTVIIVLSIAFGALILSVATYLIFEKLKYKAIKF